jgi:hypothetical protein
VRAEFFRPDAPDEIVGTADWSGDGLRFHTSDGDVQGSLVRIFRKLPVTVDDPALRQAGTKGPITLPPGTLAWFMSTARTRAQAEGLSVRLVPEGEGAMGWDPAAAYRTFAQAMERKERTGRSRADPHEQAGGSRPEGELGPSESGTEAAKPSPGTSAAGPRPGGGIP